MNSHKNNNPHRLLSFYIAECKNPARRRIADMNLDELRYHYKKMLKKDYPTMRNLAMFKRAIEIAYYGIYSDDKILKSQNNYGTLTKTIEA